MSLTQNERDRIARELLQAQADIQAKIAALGISEKPSQVKVSPDGGPVSQAHRFLKARLIPTVQVQCLDHNGILRDMVINKSDFNPEIHKIPDYDSVEKMELQKRSKRGRRSVEKEADAVDYTEASLLVMTIPALKALPEVELLEEVPEKKSELVTAILKVHKEIN